MLVLLCPHLWGVRPAKLGPPDTVCSWIRKHWYQPDLCIDCSSCFCSENTPNISLPEAQQKQTDFLPRFTLLLDSMSKKLWPASASRALIASPDCLFIEEPSQPISILLITLTQYWQICARFWQATTNWFSTSKVFQQILLQYVPLWVPHGLRER